MGPPSCDAKSHCGNPINVGIGNKYQQAADFAITSLLGFTRHYNSDKLANSQLLGPHWTHTYTRHLETVRNLGGEIAYVIAFRPEGGRTVFKEEAGLWKTEADTAVSLLPIYGQSGELLGWTYTPLDRQEVEEYDSLGRLIQIRGRNDDSVVLTYNYGNLEGNANDLLLTRVQARDGRALEFSYTPGGNIASVMDPAGHIYSYGYDAAGRLETVSYPGGGSHRYHYNEQSHTSGADLPIALTGITDENNARYAMFKYAADGRAISTEHAGAVDKFAVVYNTDGSARISGPLGETQARAFAALHGVKKAKSIVDECTGGTCAPRTIGYTHDANGRLDVVTDAAGVTTNHDYNVRGLLSQKVEAENQSTKKRITQTDWHAEMPLPLERRVRDAVNGLVAKSNWTYNARGQALTQTQTDPVTSTTRSTTTAYCEQADITAGICPLLGLVKSVDGPRTDVSDITTYTYRMADEGSCAAAPATCAYRKGDLWKVTNALGHVTETLKYDGAGRVLSVKDANGVITDLAYHPRGWLTARKLRGADPSVETDDQITRIDYWPTGLVKQVRHPDGAFTSYLYDAAHRLTDITDASGNTLHYTLDNAGNKTKEDTKDALGALKRTLSRVYNQLGQLQTQKDASQHPTGFAYDANGNVDTVTDALTHVTDNDYDPLNRLKRTLQDVGGIEAETKFDYDALDHLTKVTDPKGLDTNYVYNSLGDLTQLRSPDTGTTDYTYDSAGNRKTQTDARGITSTYTYDALNRLKTIAYSDGSPGTTYTYDTGSKTQCMLIGAGSWEFSRGRLVKITDASGSTDYCYDRFGNVGGKKQLGGVSHIVRYGYNLAGQLTQVIYPNSLVVDYVRDAQGRTVEVGVKPSGGARQVLLNQITYHPFGPVAGWTYGNGRTMQRPLNQDYQPLAIADASPGGLSLGYEFNAVGNLTRLRTADQSTLLARYDYDALNRLIDVKDGPTGTPIEHYDYDATGNRTSLTTSAGTTPYVYPATSHRLDSVGAIARSYDAVGNTTTIGGTAKEFVYGGNNRMQQVKHNGVATMTYAYNGKGEQVRRTAGAASTYTVYDEAGHWLGDYSSTTTALQNAIWLDDLPVGLIANNQLHYLEPDHLGTPRVVIDPVRNVAVWKWELTGEAFGNTLPNQDPDNDANSFVFNMRFAGQRYDAASGLSQNGFRDYEAATGRYPTSDPVGHHGGINTYAYAASNPLTWFDPDGLAAGTITYPGYYPPRTSPVPGPRPLPFPWAPAFPGCFNPIVGGILLMMVPGNIGQDASCSDDPMKRRQECRDDDDEECAKRLEREETLCRLLAGPRYPGDPERAVRVCQSAAFRRYAACLRGSPESDWPPLTGVDTPI